MSELDPSLLRQPSDTARPSLPEIFNQAGVYSSAGFPFFALRPQDYDYVGGLELLPYERGDSPSRDASDQPYNATWFEHLRKDYGSSLQLLEGLRQGYAAQCTTSGEIDGHGIVDVYHMGVQLPQFLMWRADNPIRNGEIPPAVAILRQALLGVGTTLLPLDRETIPQLEGKDIATLAEKQGDLVGDGLLAPNLPKMVCPASPDMIAGLSNALLVGNEKRGTGTLLEELDVDIARLHQFAKHIQLDVDYMDNVMLQEFETILGSQGVRFDQFSLKNAKSKITQYDEMMARYGAFLDNLQPELYKALGRTDTPPKMNLRRLYKLKSEFLNGRLQAFQLEHPDNITQAMVDEFHMYMPQR